MKNDLAIIIPFLNERENIEMLVSALNRELKALRMKTAVVFVDDGSTDGSSELLLSQSHRAYEARVIRLSRNFGSHAAVRAGILHANADILMTFNADLQDPPEVIGRLYAEIQKGHEVVWGMRDMAMVGRMEKFFSHAYAKLMRRFAIANFPENGFDIVMFRKRVQRELNRAMESHSSIFLQILSLGFSQSNITYTKQKRLHGMSKWTFGKKCKLLIDSFIAFSYTPIRFVTLLGITFSLLGLLWAGYVVIRALTLGDASPGWPALLSILMIGFGVTNISLGIVAEYLWRTLDAARGRSVFIIDSVTNIPRHPSDLSDHVSTMQQHPLNQPYQSARDACTHKQ